MTVAVVDYGMGNVRSLKNALEYIGCDVVITSDAGVLEGAERVVLPGVGAFGDAMAAIRERGLDGVLTRVALETATPVLGICLGMQLFANSSVEHGAHAGLGWLDADVRRLEPPAGYKVPHVGWNSIEFPQDDWLFAGVPRSAANFYFVHSFHMVCHDTADLLAAADYGGPVTAVVRRRNLVATQFHPEKSQDNGLALLRNWLAWSPAC
jgi:imidazole glycerol-phosphate synthase subunit HisH